MMKVERQMKTAEQREFWRQVDKSAREVDRWPAWLRGVEKDAPVNLHEMTVEEACQVKGEAGKREHRQAPGTPFVGDPVVEAYAECIDLLNYLEEAIRQGEDCAAMRGEAERLTHEMRAYLRDTRRGQADAATPNP